MYQPKVFDIGVEGADKEQYVAYSLYKTEDFYVFDGRIVVVGQSSLSVVHYKKPCQSYIHKERTK